MAALMFLLAPQAAMAADAYATHNVNLRAGPDGGYPVVDVLRAGEKVELLGCLDGYQWCEVETRYEERGWIYAPYLQTTYNNQRITIIESKPYGGTHVVIFQPSQYWNSYYRNKDFYRYRDRWIPRDASHHDHDWDNDDDDDHGHHGSNNPRPKPQPVVKELPKEPSMKMPGNSKYNPLCPIGVNKC